jgi:hypothetical protein
MKIAGQDDSGVVRSRTASGWLHFKEANLQIDLTETRLLFLLHQYNLSHTSAAELEADGGKREKMSRAALNTASRIMIDVADSLLHTGKLETMPLCCAYISRAARDYIENSGSDNFCKTHGKDLVSLTALETVFNTKWAVAL